MQYDDFITHNIDYYMGKPKSGKTLIAASYPKPLLYISVGNDGGGRVIARQYRQDCVNGNIRVKDLRNDEPVNGKIRKTSIEKLAEVLAELRQSTADKFKTIVIDTVGALQDDYKQYIEFTKGGKQLNTSDWGEVSKMILNIKDNMKRFSQETGVQIVWISHTREQEVYETSGLNKEIRIVPDLTINSGVKYLKDASNIFYCCRKTVIEPNGNRVVKFLTYVGPHPLMDTGTRDLMLEQGEFIENFNYQKWQEMIKDGNLDGVDVAVPEENKNNGEEAEKE